MTNGFGRRGFYNTQEIGLGHALVRKGHHVTIYKSIKKENSQQAETVEPEPGLTIHYLPTWGIGAHGYLPVKYLEKDMDGLVCFSDNQLFLPHIVRFCQKNNVCFVPYVGITFSHHIGMSTTGPRAKIINMMFAAGTLRCYKKIPVIAKTYGAKKELEELGVRDVIVAPVGLDTSALKSDYKKYDKVKLRAEYGFAEKDVLLCFVSRMIPEKRHLDMIEIFCHIRGKKRFKLLFAGDGPLQQEVEERVVEYGLSDDIKVLGRVPYADIWKIYAMSDYSVNLCTCEIFGMAIMEGIYYGTSVAARKAPGPSTILEGLAGHRLCENDRQVEEWLIAPCPEKKTLEESARKAVQKFSWDRCADAFTEIVMARKQRNDGKTPAGTP